MTSIRAGSSVGVFVKELEKALLNCEIDLAVHSMKDLPTLLQSGLQISAIPEREDVRDALIARVEVAMKVLKEKGGDPAEYETYLKSVAGSLTENADLKDPSKLLQLFREDQHAFGRGQGNFYRPGISTPYTRICLWALYPAAQ